MNGDFSSHSGLSLLLIVMDLTVRERARIAGGWASVGAAAAVATGSTPIGAVVVAGLGGALAWRFLGRGRAGRR
jgi:hypothetical protein